jgi:nicotinate-nucleotide pyrophosphorylase (carboxylating)
VKPSYITKSFLETFIASALIEDLGDGDHSTDAVIAKGAQGQAKLLVKDEGVLAGVELALAIFNQLDSSLRVDVKLQDGSEVKNGDVAFIVMGSVRSILTTERLVLNCMQRMSGIATLTNQLVQRVKGTKAKILDTRKTTPNFRLLEKWAVLIGGGQNHRMGLFDMVMLKDNHIDNAGGIKQAIIRTKEYLRGVNKNLKIEVETRTLEDVQQVLDEGGVDFIMLDNMSLGELKKATMMVNGRMLVEASGGITLETIKQVAETGVDLISVGALTHSYRSLDLSLKSF